mgnify:CR=1 FL=1
MPRQRAPYSAIVDRPPLKLRRAARGIIVWTIVNLRCGTSHGRWRAR